MNVLLLMFNTNLNDSVTEQIRASKIYTLLAKRSSNGTNPLSQCYYGFFILKFDRDRQSDEDGISRIYFGEYNNVITSMMQKLIK